MLDSSNQSPVLQTAVNDLVPGREQLSDSLGTVYVPPYHLQVYSAVRALAILLMAILRFSRQTLVEAFNSLNLFSNFLILA